MVQYEPIWVTCVSHQFVCENIVGKLFYSFSIMDCVHLLQNNCPFKIFIKVLISNTKKKCKLNVISLIFLKTK